MRRFPYAFALAVVPCLLLLSPRATADDLPDGTLAVEAEALVGLHADASHFQASRYEHASGGATLLPKKQPLTWKVRPKQGGTYYLWVRARSGYNDDRFYTTNAGSEYVVTLGPRKIAMEALRDTLDWYGDGENFIWLRSEPLNLDPREQAIQLLAKWDWAHVDRLVLSNDASYRPGIGNVASNDQLAGELVVWGESPYRHPLPPDLAAPKEPKAEVSMIAPRGGSGNGAVIVRLESEGDVAVPFRLFVQPLRGPGGAVLRPRLALVATTGMLVGASLATDGLPEINPIGAFELTPGTARMLWVWVDVPADATPGSYAGSVTIENQISLKQQGVPIRLQVAATTMAPRVDELATFGWWGNARMPKAWWDDQIAHGNNSFLLNVHHDLRFRFDERGELREPIEFASLGPLLTAWQQSRGSILVNWYLHDAKRSQLVSEAPGLPEGDRGTPLEFMSEPWQKAFSTLLLETQRYLESNGVPREKILHYTFDEYLGERFVQVGQVIRSLDPSYQIFSDLSADLETYRRVAPYVDVWCPFFHDLEAMQADGRLAFMRSTGKQIWAYDAGYTQRGEPPYSKFRLKFWQAWKYRLDGCTYWKHQGDRVGTAYYGLVESDPPVTGRRYEAWFSGWQDYQLLLGLDRVTRAGGSQAGAAKQLLDEAVARVCERPEDTTLADQYRRKMLELLDAAAAP